MPVNTFMHVNVPTTGVLILTAYDDDPYVMAVLQAGANGYVLKTASPAEIIQFDKLQATSRTEAVMRAVSLGWLLPRLGELGDG